MHFPSLLDLTFDTLFGCIGVLGFIFLERSIYLTYLAWRMRQLGQIIRPNEAGAGRQLSSITSSDPITRAVRRYAELLLPGPSREQQEDWSSALFIGVDKRISARLWILDTIVTAAPLLGLLGTILGIMDTFNALSAGGVSDPAAVSRGIGTALRATAIGIAAALGGLLGNNILARRAHVLTEDFKALLLNLTSVEPLRLPRNAPRSTVSAPAFTAQASNAPAP
jgi:biopolymer transport protein ExbB